jgi:hypothetical protein
MYYDGQQFSFITTQIHTTLQNKGSMDIVTIRNEGRWTVESLAFMLTVELTARTLTHSYSDPSPSQLIREHLKHRATSEFIYVYVTGL